MFDREPALSFTTLALGPSLLFLSLSCLSALLGSKTATTFSHYETDFSHSETIKLKSDSAVKRDRTHVNKAIALTQAIPLKKGIHYCTKRLEPSNKEYKS